MPYAEVRNLIYAYTTETSTVALHGPTRPDGHQEPAPIAHAQWPHLKRQWLGLTQVCQQIRSEFLPIHREATGHQVYMYLVDVPDYINIFIDNHGCCDADIIGRLTIDMRRRNSNGHLNPASVNILPLLKICLGKPPGASKFHVTFTDSQALSREGYSTGIGPHIRAGGVYQDLTAMFHPMANKKWRAFVMQYVSSFVVNLNDARTPRCKMGILRDYFYGGERLGYDFLPIINGPLNHNFRSKLPRETRKTRAMSLRTPMPLLISPTTILIE
ncbi:hypothetical protein HBI70_194020 [Parastagonospora nodorum]|nr:hypothetical protein HBI70_194020 [Parastagonospora nodorum]